MNRRARAWLERAVLAALAVCFVSALSHFCYDPFTLRGDGPVYFLPLLHATTSSLLHGQFPWVFWQLGAGWSPFESGQVGLGYPPFLLTAVLCEVAGKPLAFLRISAALHLILVGLLVRELAPRSSAPAARFSAALVAIAQPAPLLLGMQWHVYLCSYPWQLALVLLLWYGDSRSLSVRLGVPIAGALLFWSGHPQMFIWSSLFLVLSTWALRRPSWRDLALFSRPLAALTLAVIVPLVGIYLASREANGSWMSKRDEAGFILSQAQGFADVLPGLLLGNIVGPQRLQAWGMDEAAGAGIFFCPLAVGALGYMIRRRNLAAIALLAFALLLLAPRGITDLRWLAIGPFARFRWTWRLCTLLLPPLALAVALGARPGDASEVPRTPLWRLATNLGVLVLGLGVVLRGTTFDLATAWWGVRAAGIEGIVRETQRFAQTLHAPARIALIGEAGLLRSSVALPLPLAYLGLVGNAPLLIRGLESAHLYEPLESNRAAAAHDGLGPPWRVAVRRSIYKRDSDVDLARLQAIGVTALVALAATVLPEDEQTRCFVGSDGVPLWVRELAPSPPYPLRGPGQRRADGSLSIDSPDSLRSTRPLLITTQQGLGIATLPTPWLLLVLGSCGVVAAVALLVVDAHLSASARIPAAPRTRR